MMHGGSEGKGFVWVNMCISSLRSACDCQGKLLCGFCLHLSFPTLALRENFAKDNPAHALANRLTQNENC